MEALLGNPGLLGELMCLSHRLLQASELWAPRSGPLPTQSCCSRTPSVCQEQHVLPQASPGSSSGYLISRSPSVKEQKLEPAAHPWRASLGNYCHRLSQKVQISNMPLTFSVLWVATDERQRRLQKSFVLLSSINGVKWWWDLKIPR